MGMSNSRPLYMQILKAEIETKISLRFPGFKEHDEKFLEHRIEVISALKFMSGHFLTAVGKIGLQVPVPVLQIGQIPVCNILSIIKSLAMCADSTEDAMLELKIEKAVVNAVQPVLKAEFASIQQQLEFMLDEEIDAAERNIHLITAYDSVYRLFLKFLDTSFYLRKYPLVFSPFFLSFTAVYVPIALAALQTKPSSLKLRKYQETFVEMKKLLLWFQERAVAERLEYIMYQVKSPWCVNDEFLPYDRSMIHKERRYEFTGILDEIYEWYRNAIKDLYSGYFSDAIDTMNLFENTMMDAY